MFCFHDGIYDEEIVMFFTKKYFIKFLSINLAFILTSIFVSPTHAMEDSKLKVPPKRQQQHITDYFKKKTSEKQKYTPAPSLKTPATTAISRGTKRKAPENPIRTSPPSKVAKATTLSSPSSSAVSSVIQRPSTPKSSSSKPVQGKTGTLPFQRIVGEQEHVTELLSLIRSAQKKIEIFSWTLGYLPTDLFKALCNASNRGVEILLTVQDVKREETLEALEEENIQVNDGRKTHTKFVIADKHTAMVGSYNYLSWKNNDEEYGVGDKESSCKITGNTDIITRIRGRIYRDMIAYEKGEAPLIHPFSMDLPRDSTFFLLTNLRHHQDFFKCAIQNARDKIIIYSPFIYGRNTLAQLKIIEEKVGEKVFLVIHIKPDDTRQLNWALAQVPQLKKRFKILPSQFHRKSLLIDPQSDNCHFCDGSFNWFSAATDIENEACNQETSIVLTGPRARHYLGDHEMND